MLRNWIHFPKINAFSFMSGKFPWNEPCPSFLCSVWPLYDLDSTLSPWPPDLVILEVPLSGSFTAQDFNQYPGPWNCMAWCTRTGPELAKIMMTSSNEDIFHITVRLCGEFTSEFSTQRPVTQSFDVFFDLRLNKQLNKQWGWWFGMTSRPLWRDCNVLVTELGYLLSTTWIHSDSVSGSVP